MRILITGAGLLGCHVAEELLRAGHEPAAFDLSPDPDYLRGVAGLDVPIHQGDIGDLERMGRALRLHQAEVVVHTAGLVGRKAEDNPYLAFIVNAHGTATVAEACRAAGVRHLVHASSLAVYDWSAAAPPAVAETVPSGPSGIYGASKVAAEAVVRGYGHRGWLGVTILRFSGVYGFGHFRGGSRLGATMVALLRRCLEGEHVTLPSGWQSCELLYACDAAEAVRLAVARDGGVEVVNVGTGTLVTATELADALRRAVPGAQVHPAGDGSGDALPLDVRKAEQLLSFRAGTALHDGLADLRCRLSDRKTVTVSCDG